jgi:photosystem II stability/assembly factor-like uncharacterized protein
MKPRSTALRRARATESLTLHRNRKQPQRTAWIAALLALAAITAAAQGEVEDSPEFAVMAPLASRSLALDAVAVDGTLVAVGQRGHILISQDGGATWKQSEVPTRSLLTGVYFHDGNLGWVVGHDSVILKTVDGGESWKRVHWAPEDEAPFFDVWFSDADNGFAIGAYGSFFVTTDGGETWQFEPISDYDFHLHHMAPAANGTLYMAAEAGMVYRSDDGGATWKELPSPYEGSFFGVLPLQGDEVLLFGLRGHLFRSEDAGDTWQELPTGTVGMLTNGVRLSNGTIVISGLGGAVLISSDGGRSFTLHQQDNRRGIATAVDMGGGSLLLAGEFGVRTTTVDDLAVASD